MAGRMEREREKGKKERSRDTRFIIGRKKERERGGIDTGEEWRIFVEF